jgi:hypothetical protein
LGATIFLRASVVIKVRHGIFDLDFLEESFAAMRKSSLGNQAIPGIFRTFLPGMNVALTDSRSTLRGSYETSKNNTNRNRIALAVDVGAVCNWPGAG